MCTGTKSKPHIHAELIKAWADGAEIQILENVGWQDVNPSWSKSCTYRIKPAPKVKKYLFAYITICGDTPKITTSYFSCVEDAFGGYHNNLKWYQRIDASVIEV